MCVSAVRKVIAPTIFYHAENAFCISVGRVFCLVSFASILAFYYVALLKADIINHYGHGLAMQC